VNRARPRRSRTLARQISVIAYSPSMNGKRPESAGFFGNSEDPNALQHWEITGLREARREPPEANPLVAGSSPARPTLFTHFIGTLASRRAAS
jgi:hypothetical protein